MIYDYCQKNNRPHAVQSLIVAFKAQFSKSYAQKALDSLEKKKKISCKTSGKAKVYYINQELLETVSKEKLFEMDEEITEMTKEYRALDEKLKICTKENDTLKRELTVEKLKEKIEAQKKEVKNN
jgi:hypothetical protein